MWLRTHHITYDSHLNFVRIANLYIFWQFPDVQYLRSYYQDLENLSFTEAFGRPHEIWLVANLVK